MGRDSMVVAAWHMPALASCRAAEVFDAVRWLLTLNALSRHILACL